MDRNVLEAIFGVLLSEGAKHSPTRTNNNELVRSSRNTSSNLDNNYEYFNTQQASTSSNNLISNSSANRSQDFENYCYNHPQETTNLDRDIPDGVQITDLDRQALELTNLQNSISDEAIQNFLSDTLHLENQKSAYGLFNEILGVLRQTTTNPSLNGKVEAKLANYIEILSKQPISEESSLLKKFLGETGNMTINDLIEKFSHSELITSTIDLFTNVNIIINPLACVTAFFTFKKLVKLYADVAFKDVKIDKPEMLALKNKQTILFMVFGALPITFCLLKINDLTLAKRVSIESNDIKNITSSASSLLPFLSFKFKKFKFNIKYFLLLTIIIVLLNPFNINDLILASYSFKLVLLILVIIYILLITYSGLNLLLLYLFTNDIINLKHYESSSNYFIKLLLIKQKISKSNDFNIYIRLYKVNLIAYTILLLFAVTLLFLGIN